jgi:hypothetical protein
VEFVKQHRVSVRCGDLDVAICLIGFSKTGYFVSFPYHPDSQGIASLGALLPTGPTGSQNIDMTENGRVTTHKVKYSHHVDGSTHFSQYGKVVTVIRTKSIPLNQNRSPAPHVFSVYVGGLPSLARHKPRHGLPTFMAQGDLPPSLRIVGYWYTMTPKVGVQNPAVAQDPQGQNHIGYACAPPGSFPLNGTILLQAFENPPEVMDPDKQFQVLFTGGFSETIDDRAKGASFLALNYPASEVKGLPSMDWVKSELPGRT